MLVSAVSARWIDVPGYIYGRRMHAMEQWSCYSAQHIIWQDACNGEGTILVNFAVVSLFLPFLQHFHLGAIAESMFF